MDVQKSRINSMGRKENREVLNQVIERGIMKNIRTRHLIYFGHVKRHKIIKKNLKERKSRKNRSKRLTVI